MSELEKLFYDCVELGVDRITFDHWNGANLCWTAQFSGSDGWDEIESEGGNPLECLQNALEKHAEI